MITQNDVLETMRAVDPSTTDAQAIRFHQTIETALDARIELLQSRMKERFRRQHGRLPDSLTWEQMIDRISIDAENQIRGEYLDELTAQATEQALQAEEEQMELTQDMLMESTEAWKTRWAEMRVPDHILDRTVEMWPDEAETPETRDFYQLAAALLASMEYRGLGTPAVPGDPRLPEIQRQVHEAMGTTPPQ